MMARLEEEVDYGVPLRWALCRVMGSPWDRVQLIILVIVPGDLLALDGLFRSLGALCWLIGRLEWSLADSPEHCAR